MSDVRAVYGWRAVSRWAFLVATAVGALGAVPMLLGVAVTVDSWAWRVALPIASLLWLAGALLTLSRTALTIEITADELRWRGAIRHGVTPVDAVRGVRPVRVLEIVGLHALVIDGRSPIWVLVARGFDEFAEDVRSRAGTLDVRLSWATPRPGRVPGRNLYRRVGDRLG